MHQYEEDIKALLQSTIDYSEEIADEEILKRIDSAMLGCDWRTSISKAERIKIRKNVFNSLKKYDCIQEFLEDETVTEIMINGLDPIIIERNGRLEFTNRSFVSGERLMDMIQQIVGECNRSVNEFSPIQDARLPTKERVNIVLDPIAINGPIVTIRRFPVKPIRMEDLIQYDSLTVEAAKFLEKLVIDKYNIFISGGTGSGKTTFLNALSYYIPQNERIITIEDSAELQILHSKNLVRLEARGENSEGVKEITIRDLIKTSLRMRPERIIVGECRGAEALDMLQAMNTGHDGSLSTGHANGTYEMIKRLETMVLMGMDLPIQAIREQIASAIDIFIHLARMGDGSRKVMEIAEVVGVVDKKIELNPIFQRKNNVLEKVGSLVHADKRNGG